MSIDFASDAAMARLSFTVDSEKTVMGPVPAGPQADPDGHLWGFDWLNFHEGFRCTRCNLPGYRYVQGQPCRKARRSGVAS